MSIWLRLTSRVRSADLQRKIEERGPGLATEEVEAAWRDQVHVASIAAYQTGLAEGELRGRLALAAEIENAFGPSGQEITPDAATKIRQRQVH